MFLDPHKPIATCRAAECQGCPAKERLQCHFGSRQLLPFVALALPPFIIGGAGIAHISGWYLVPWLAFILSFFGVIEIRALCSHCPHYAEPSTRTLQCWANYGSPKLWKYRPGPMAGWEKAVFIGGIGLIAGYPLAFLLAGAQWLLLALFGLAAAAGGAYMVTQMCPRCMNFACPFNRVEHETRQAFFARNPAAAEGWKEKV